MVKRKRRKRTVTPAKPVRAIHARIAELREDRGLSQQDLADAVGVDKTAVSHWENGLSAPKGSRLPAVATALGVSLDELFGEAA